MVQRCPYGKAGDLLWVRETFIHEPADYCWEASVSIPVRPAHTVYRADVDPTGDGRGAGWSPSIHMPRWASRITLEVTGVRVERLQDISRDDAISEGVDPHRCPTQQTEASMRAQLVAHRIGMAAHYVAEIDYIGGFRWLWESINGAGSWDANPWVWVIEFRKV